MDLRTRYTQQLAERGFRADPVQAAVIDRLDGLRRRLVAAREADSSLVRRWFGALGGKASLIAPRRWVIDSRVLAAMIWECRSISSRVSSVATADKSAPTT